ncbi:hypothetical protein V2J09_016933, partial [Rumex salicifolius]
IEEVVKKSFSVFSFSSSLPSSGTTLSRAGKRRSCQIQTLMEEGPYKAYFGGYPFTSISSPSST